MPNIRIDLEATVINGQALTFKSPADCSQVTGLIIYYPVGDTTTSKEFKFVDAHGVDVGSGTISLFAENVLVKVILDTDSGKAYVQNADTNAYLEGRFDDMSRQFSAVKRNVGDIIETVRTDLDDRWLLCNGDIVPEGEYPALREKLFYNTEWRRIMPSFSAGALNSSTVDYYSVRPLTIPGKWALVYAYPSGLYSPSSGRLAVYDDVTDTLTNITRPTVSGATKDYGIFGLTHDGDRYVLGIYETNDGTTAGKVRLYTSTDLVTWKLGYTFSCASYTDLALDLSFDGTNILYYEYSNLSTEYANYDGIYSINKAMTKKTKLFGPSQNYSNRFVVLPNGYWSYANPDNEGISVYAAGGTSSLFYFPTSGYTPRIAYFNERYWVGLPKDSPAAPYIYVADLTTNKVDNLYVADLVEVEYAEHAYLQGATYDRNTREWTFILYSHKTGMGNAGKKYYAAYISEDANPLDKTQYRVVPVSGHVTDDLSYEQMAPDRSQMRLSTSSADQYLRDPNLKYLPSNDGDAYKYIYKGDDET